MHFCQVIEVGEDPTVYAVVAPSRFQSVPGITLRTFAAEYRAIAYCRKVNGLARCFRGGRARDAKDPS